jgi:hypothetical protein
MKLIKFLQFPIAKDDHVSIELARTRLAFGYSLYKSPPPHYLLKITQIEQFT